MSNNKKQNQTKNSAQANKTKIGFFGLLNRYYVRYYKLFLGMTFFVLLTALCAIAQPKLTNLLLTSLFNEAAAEAAGDVYTGTPWQTYAYIMLSLLILYGIFLYSSNVLGGKMGRSIEIQIRNEALTNLIRQDMSYYYDKQIGGILTRVISDTEQIGLQAQQIPAAIMSATFTFFGGIIILFTIDWQLTIVALVTCLLIFVIVMTSFSVLRSKMLNVRKTLTEVNSDVADRLNTVRLIKSSGTEEYEKERFETVHKKYYNVSKVAIQWQSFIISIIMIGVSSISVIITISAAIIYNDDPEALIAILPSFLSGLMILTMPIVQLARMTQGLAQASASAERIYEIMIAETKIDVTSEGVHIQDLESDIIFSNVTFSYPEKPNQLILPQTSFTFKKGKRYAFVGETGVGKSTISKLLLRFYDPSSGAIYINNNINLKDVYLPSYLDKVGYVEQEPQILFGNIYDNVRYSKFDATDEEVIEACKKAKLDEIISTWAEGYSTILGERGFILSGGQKQRLVISRMFLKNPQLLILDEATSSLDNIVEAEIQAQLEKLMEGRTSISIAHRLSTIKNSDQIIVLQKDVGIVEVGTFNELVKKPGRFQNLYKAGLMK